MGERDGPPFSGHQGQRPTAPTCGCFCYRSVLEADPVHLLLLSVGWGCGTWRSSRPRRRPPPDGRRAAGSRRPRSDMFYLRPTMGRRRGRGRLRRVVLDEEVENLLLLLQKMGWKSACSDLTAVKGGASRGPALVYHWRRHGLASATYSKVRSPSGRSWSPMHGSTDRKSVV